MTRRIVAAVALLAAGCTSSSTVASHSTSGGATRATHPASRSAHAPVVTALHVSTVMHLPVGVSRTVVVADGGSLVVLGGLAAGDTTTARVWVVDPRRHRARAAGSLTQASHDASGAFLDGSADVFAGGAATTLTAVQAWRAGHTRVIGSLPSPRSDSAAAVIGNTAYVVGGFDGHAMTRDVLATADGHRWRVVARLRVGVRYPAVAAIGAAVYVVGGALATTEGTASGPQTAAVQRVDVRTGRVTIVGHLSRPLAHATAFSVGGRLFVAGGRHGATPTSAVSVVDLGTGHEHEVARLPVALSDAGVAVTGSTAWLVGGETAGPGAPVSTIYALTASA